MIERIGSVPPPIPAGERPRCVLCGGSHANGMCIADAEARRVAMERYRNNDKKPGITAPVDTVEISGN